MHVFPKTTQTETKCMCSTPPTNTECCFMYSQMRGLCPVKQIFHQEVDNTLIFEARFESGNLQKVVKV